jgi:16S rRNA (uracil1498-N3)-methyltransferase
MHCGAAFQQHSRNLSHGGGTRLRRRFFVERFTGDKATLAGEGAHHLGRVLRAEAGQVYELSDGLSVRLGRVERMGRGSVEFALLEPVPERAPRLRATVLLSVVKFARFEWALEKATELGAETIVPLAAQRSERALLAASAKRARRWQRIVLESAQQARCLRPPNLAPLARPGDAFAARNEPVRLLLSERAGAPRLRRVLETASEGQATTREARVDLCLAIGPEGGWTEEEFAAAAMAGFAEGSLGGQVLRTETAVIAGLAAAHLYFDT